VREVPRRRARFRPAGVGYREAAVSAPVASSVGGSLNGSVGSESRASARGSGNRAATVQQVPAERNEQSGSRGGVREEDWAATPHPQSITVPNPTSRADRGRRIAPPNGWTEDMSAETAAPAAPRRSDTQRHYFDMGDGLAPARSHGVARHGEAPGPTQRRPVRLLLGLPRRDGQRHADGEIQKSEFQRDSTTMRQSGRSALPATCTVG
jgi:hypothetical protein